ncbi:hypothetical protein ACHAQA_002317 [Verticillium albo-atrum]
MSDIHLQALNLQGQSADNAKVQNSTTGVLFLSTPHAGSDLAFWPLFFGPLLDSPKRLLNILQIGSPSLTALNNGFSTYYYSRRESKMPLSVRTFGEMRKTGPGLVAKTVVPEHSAKTGLPDENFTMCDKDHQTIARFSDPSDEVFDLIWRQLERWVNDGRLSVQLPSRVQYWKLPEKTNQFVGRLRELKQLESLLNSSKHSPTVALWGRGGMGKTELFLEYAETHRDRYRTVVCFDARSEKDLKASYEEFFDYLIERNDAHLVQNAGNNCKDRVKAVIRWFREEKDWLTIFDNVDLDDQVKESRLEGDEESLSRRVWKLEAYLPLNPSAHRILVSRSPNIFDPKYAAKEIELGPMKEDDAQEMLLRRSGPVYEHRTPEILLTAKKLAKSLDHSPSFIEVAARYIHNTQTSLAGYAKELENEKQNMRLGSQRGLLGDAYASWNLSLKALDSKETTKLLLRLFSLLDGASISPELFDRASKPRFRWNEDGKVVERTPEESGVHPDLISLFQNPMALSNAIQPLIDKSFIRREQEGQTIELPQTIQQYVIRTMSREERLESIQMTIRVVSHAFPEDPTLEHMFDALRAKFNKHVFRCLEYFQTYGDELGAVTSHLTTMSLAALGRSGNEEWLLDPADALVHLTNDGYHRCLAAKWRAYRLWYDNEKPEAEAVLKRCQLAEEHAAAVRGQPQDARANAALGDLIMHRAQFLFETEAFDEGSRILRSWKRMPDQSDSQMERRTALYVNTALAKRQIAEGAPDSATTTLEALVEGTKPLPTDIALKKSDLNWATVLLGQLYCLRGLGTDAAARAAPGKLVKLLEPRVEELLALQARYEFITSDFRLLLCEARLQMGKHELVQQELAALVTDLGHPLQVGNPRSQSQLSKARIMEARVLHVRREWTAAVAAWRVALRMEGVSDASLDVGDVELAGHHQVAVCVYSLGIAVFFEGDRKRAAKLVDLVKGDPKSGYLVNPVGKLDYTGWVSELDKQYAVIKGQLGYRSLLRWGRSS